MVTFETQLAKLLAWFDSVHTPSTVVFFALIAFWVGVGVGMLGQIVIVGCP